MVSTWKIQLLGRLQMEQGSRTIARFRTHKIGVLLAYLAIDAERSSPREALIELLLTAERENLAAALEWHISQGEAEDAARFAVALADYWEMRGLFGEARGFFRRCLERQDAIHETRRRARLLGVAGWFAHLQADYEEANSLQQAGLVLCKQSHDEEGEAQALNNLAVTAQTQGRLTEARTCYERSLNIACRLGDEAMQAARWSNLALRAIRERRYEEARGYLNEAYASYERSHDLAATSACLCNLGDLELRQRRLEEAEEYALRAMYLFRQLNDRQGIAYTLAEVALNRSWRIEARYALTRWLPVGCKTSRSHCAEARFCAERVECERRYEMHGGFIQSSIARGNRNRLLIGLTFSIVGGGMAALLGIWTPALVAIPGIFWLGRWLKNMINPGAHPVYKWLAHYGDVQQVVQQVNEEFATVKVDDKPHFGAKWLAQGDFYGVSLAPWQDIAWLYVQSETLGRTGSATWVKIHTRDNGLVLVPTQWERANQQLGELHARAPWAEVGNTPELYQRWTQNRADFLERVDARKAAQSDPALR